MSVCPSHDGCKDIGSKTVTRGAKNTVWTEDFPIFYHAGQNKSIFLKRTIRRCMLHALRWFNIHFCFKNGVDVNNNQVQLNFIGLI